MISQWVSLRRAEDGSSAGAAKREELGACSCMDDADLRHAVEDAGFSTLDSYSPGSVIVSIEGDAVMVYSTKTMGYEFTEGVPGFVEARLAEIVGDRGYFHAPGLVLSSDEGRREDVRGADVSGFSSEIGRNGYDAIPVKITPFSIEIHVSGREVGAVHSGNGTLYVYGSANAREATYLSRAAMRHGMESRVNVALRAEAVGLLSERLRESGMELAGKRTKLDIVTTSTGKKVGGYYPEGRSVWAIGDANDMYARLLYDIALQKGFKFSMYDRNVFPSIPA